MGKVWAMLALIAGLGSGQALGHSCASPANRAALEAGLLDWINQERAGKVLKPYARSAKLDCAARAHACDMALRNYFAHTGPGEASLAHRLKATGYELRAGSENIAYTQQAKVISVAPIWRNSPPHWAAIIDPALHDIGISVTTGNGRIYWVMDVARSGVAFVILP